MLPSTRATRSSPTTPIALNRNSANVANTNTTKGVHRYINKDAINTKKNAGKMAMLSELKKDRHQRHPLYMTEFALEIYTVLVVFLLTRRYWTLHGITLVILAHIADILYSWFIHMKEAREIRLFKSWLLWWIRIGLDFATSTVEGELVHRVLVANTLNFWNAIGKKYTISWFDDIASKGRTNFVNRAKEQLNQLKVNHSDFESSLRNSQ